MYPWLWVGTSFFCLVNLLSQPFWGLLFVIDKDLFVEHDDFHPVSTISEYMPRDGLPYFLAETYRIYGLLWADDAYLIDDDLSLRFDNFVQMYFISLFQLFTGIILDPIMFLASFVSLGFLSVLGVMELFVESE